MYFEDFKLGLALETPSRTVTAADITNFCCLSGDFNEVHANIEYVKTTQFRDFIAHGPLVYAIVGGLQYASGINDGTLIALLGINNWTLKDPVYAGDTIRMRQTVMETRQSSKPEQGIVKMERKILNQKNQVAQEMEAALLYRCRPAV